MFSYAITIETEENIVLAGEHICVSLSRFSYVTVGYNQENGRILFQNGCNTLHTVSIVHYMFATLNILPDEPLPHSKSPMPLPQDLQYIVTHPQDSSHVAFQPDSSRHVARGRRRRRRMQQRTPGTTSG
jgi:hypothetical protein